jgi:hypothetical protein
MPDSHIGRVLTRVSKSFRDLARVGENAARHELEVLTGEDKAEGAGKEGTDEELRAVDAEVKATLTGLKERGSLLIGDHCTKITEALRGAMQSFSDAECAKLREAIAEGHRSSRVWSCDFTLLRQQLEEALVLAYRKAEQELRNIETEGFLQLQQMLTRYNPQWARPEVGSDPTGMELPTIGTPSIVLELDEPWWRRWWRRSRSGERRAAALARLIEKEFSAIAGPLTQAARTQLEARQSAALQEAHLVYVGLIDLLKEQNRTRLERETASHPDDELLRESPEMQKIRETMIAELKKLASDMGLLADRLESIDRDVHRHDAPVR